MENAVKSSDYILNVIYFRKLSEIAIALYLVVCIISECKEAR